MKRSKRYTKAQTLVKDEKAYSLEEAIDLIRSMPHVKFDETLEICTKTGIDPQASDQMVRGSVVLPHGTGKKIRILVFCESEKENDAKEAGADYVGSDEIIEKILKEGWLDFDYCIATPSMMRAVSKLGKFLGPRGLMPSPKTGTVTENISAAIQEAKRGKIDFRMDKAGVVQAAIGKVSFSKEALVENARTFIEALRAVRPGSLKGDFAKTLYLSSTMGPSVHISE